MEFTQSEIIKATALSTSSSYTYDLGIQGISYLWFELQALQNAAHTIEEPDDLLSCISSIAVTSGGANIISGRGKDLARLGAIIAGIPYRFTAAADAANAQAGIMFCLPFGRRLFHPAEGLPTAQRGLLQVTVQTPSSFTPLVSPHLTIHQVEIPGNQFRRYNKYTQRTATPGATGLYDFPLPIGNKLRGVFFAGSTAYRNEASQGTAQQAILMVNNVERYFTGGIFGHTQQLGANQIAHDVSLQVAQKLENTAASYTQNALTDAGLTGVVPVLANNSWMDLDPTQDDTFALDTPGLNLLSARYDFAIAEQAWVYAYESVAVR